MAEPDTIHQGGTGDGGRGAAAGGSVTAKLDKLIEAAAAAEAVAQPPGKA